MKSLLPIAGAAAMIVSSTAAHAATRPEPTRLSPPVADANAIANPEDDRREVPFELILLGLGGLLGVLLFAASGNGNSPR